jgi:hypothetical protein
LENAIKVTKRGQRMTTTRCSRECHQRHLPDRRLVRRSPPRRIKTYFDTTNMNRLIHQTRMRNVSDARQIRADSGNRFCQEPDGVALPSEFNIRYVLARIPRLFLGIA